MQKCLFYYFSFDREYGKSVFLGAHGDGTSRSLSSVEQFALNNYKTEGYTDGKVLVGFSYCHEN